MMNRLQVLFGFVAILASAFGKPSDGCGGTIYTINGTNYIRELLKDNISIVESISYDRSTNSLFLLHHDDYTPMAAKINLDTNEFKTIDGVENVTQVSVDAKTYDVYIAADGEIYKYNKSTNRAELYASSDSSINRFMHFVYAKDVVYFAGYPTWNVSKIENGEVSEFKELGRTKIRYMVIDDNDNVFFTNSTGLYRKNKGSDKVVYYQSSEGLTPFEGLAVSQLGEVYATGCNLSGIYYVGKDTDILVGVVRDNARAITFDGYNNIIYSTYSTLYRFKPSHNCV